MRNITIILAVLLLAGCQSIGKHAIKDLDTINKVLAAGIPLDFAGGALHVEIHNMYVDGVLDGGNVHTYGEGARRRFSFDWIEFTGKSHFPFFAGLTWTSDDNFRLGNKPSVEALQATVNAQNQQMQAMQVQVQQMQAAQFKP